MSDHPATLSKNPVRSVRSESVLLHLRCFLLVIFHLLTPTRFLGCTFSLFFVILRTECNLSPPRQNPITEVPMHTVSGCVHVRACLFSHVQLFGTPPGVLCSPPGSSVHGISQARILEWVAISFSRGSSQPRDQILVSSLAGRFFTTKPPGKSLW